MIQLRAIPTIFVGCCMTLACGKARDGEPAVPEFSFTPAAYGQALKLHDDPDDDTFECNVTIPIEGGIETKGRYHLDAIDRFLSSTPEAVELLGFNSVGTDCAKMDMVVAVKRYLGDLESGNDKPARPEFLEDENNSDSASLIYGTATNDPDWLVRIGGCNGAQISPRHILSSAHCADDWSNNSSQVVERWTASNTQLQIQNGNVCRTIHPNYNGGYFWNYDDEDDIAVIYDCNGNFASNLGTGNYARLARTFTGSGGTVRLVAAGRTTKTCTANREKRVVYTTVDSLDARDIEFNLSIGSVEVCDGDSGGIIMANGVGANGYVQGLFSSPSSFTSGWFICYSPLLACGGGGEGHATRVWVPKEAWIEAQIGYQCTETTYYADCSTAATGGGGCSSEGSGLTCLDGQDNDCDGNTDCADSGCFSHPDCLGL